MREQWDSVVYSCIANEHHQTFVHQRGRNEDFINEASLQNRFGRVWETDNGSLWISYLINRWQLACIKSLASGHFSRLHSTSVIQTQDIARKMTATKREEFLRLLTSFCQFSPRCSVVIKYRQSHFLSIILSLICWRDSLNELRVFWKTQYAQFILL